MVLTGLSTRRATGAGSTAASQHSSTAEARAASSTAAGEASPSTVSQHDSMVAAPLAWEHPQHAALASWHFDMVADTGRNGAYRRAIEAAVARARRGLAAGQALHVVDVGSGSGLLAMMAARWAASAAACCLPVSFRLLAAATPTWHASMRCCDQSASSQQ